MQPTIKAIPVSAYPDSAWRVVLGVGESEGGDAYAMYRRVAVVYRCIRMRSKAVRAMPLALYRGARDISETPDGIMELRRIRHLMYLGNASQLVYGAAYGLRQTGRYTGLPFVRWVASPTMQPKYDKDQGISGFVRTIRDANGAIEKPYRPDEVWHAWLQNLSADVGPDVAPAEVALRAAGVLDDVSKFLQMYFSNGAIQPTLVKVPSATSEPERKRVGAWYRKMLTGIKNAFRVEVVGADVDVVKMGDVLTDVLPENLVDQQTMDVLTAMEVPASLVLANAANYATAERDALNFLEYTTIPDAELLRDTLNEQHYGLLGYEIVLLPERLEVRQKAEAEKAQGLNQLTDLPVMTQGEARQRLELPPIEPDAAEQERLSVMAQLQLMEAAARAGLSKREAARLAGLEATLDPESETPPTPPQPAPAAPEPEAQRRADLERWQRKALKALGAGRAAAVPFESSWIDPFDADLITHSLNHADSSQAVKAAFAIKAPGDGLSPTEYGFWIAIRDTFAEYAPKVLAAIIAGEPVNLSAMDDALKAELVPTLADLALMLVDSISDEIGVVVDEAESAAAMQAWAALHAESLVGGLRQTTGSLIDGAIEAYRTTPGMTTEQVARLLAPAFGERRAETIAITETTNAASAATNEYQQQLKAAGLEFERVWRTDNDDSVCPICAPLNGKPESVWMDQFPDGPAAHSRCRCTTTLRRKRGEG